MKILKWFSTVYKWVYVKFTGKCPYCGEVLYDPSVSGQSNMRECPKCGIFWIL